MTVTKEAAHYMRSACRKTRVLVAAHPVERDVLAKYEASQAWPLVGPLYSGIEQALKMLILAPTTPRFNLDDLKRNYGHNLVKLHAELIADDRAHIESHFQEHWSLYRYDTGRANLTNAEQFIAQVSGPSHDGFFAWRYFLIDEAMSVPTVSLLTMCEIWDAICCCIRREVLERPNDCSSLSRRMMRGFDGQFPIPVTYDAFGDDMRTWLFHIETSPLAAWIDLLVKTHGNTISEVKASDELRPVLAEMADMALAQMASDSADPDEAQLLHRIQTDPNLAWNPTDGVFH